MEEQEFVPQLCKHCGLEVEDRGYPLIQKDTNWYSQWVHADWGGRVCHPQLGGKSTLAEPVTA
jgi:transcription elongation factor Elf1